MISLLFRGVERPGGEKSEKGLDTPAAWPYPAAAMGSTAVQTDRPTLEPEPLEGRRQVPASDEIHTAAPGQIPTLQEVILDLEGTVRRLRLEQIEWHQQTNYWKALHERAVQREAVQKETIRDLESRVRALTHELKDYEELKAKHELLKQMHFGRKTEQQRERKGEESEADGQDKGPDPPDRPSRKRGQQPGRKGHGRKIRKDLPKEEIWHELPQEEQCCPKCSKCFEDFPGTEDSEEIHIEVRVFRRVHKRKRYKSTCQCGAVPGIVTAPCVRKLILKGLFSVGFWVWLILEKFLFQRPLYRVRKVLALQGLTVSQGTLTGGLNRIGDLVQPLYAKILERSRSARHWHMDETRWLVFEEIEGKEGHRWWLWVVVSKDTCSFILDPSRSAEVPKAHLGKDAQGIMNVDRYSSYKAFAAVRELIKLAFCWAHVRRDFLRVGKGYKKLQAWSEEWVERINKLFYLNRLRLEVIGQEGKYAYRQRKLREAVEQMAKQRENELAEEGIHPAQKKVLTSLHNHWEGLTLFVANPEIPMDNNEAERALRNAVVGRKNFYGNGAVWSGILTAALYTILETATRNDINPQRYLQVYFEACAENGGKPPEDIEAFLPWSLSKEVRNAM